MFSGSPSAIHKGYLKTYTGLYDRLYYAWLPLIISPIEPFLLYLPCRDIYGTTPPEVFR